MTSCSGDIDKGKKLADEIETLGKRIISNMDKIQEAVIARKKPGEDIQKACVDDMDKLADIMLKMKEEKDMLVTKQDDKRACESLNNIAEKIQILGNHIDTGLKLNSSPRNEKDIEENFKKVQQAGLETFYNGMIKFASKTQRL